jgi:hypothetical protein
MRMCEDTYLFPLNLRPLAFVCMCAECVGCHGGRQKRGVHVRAGDGAASVPTHALGE